MGRIKTYATWRSDNNVIELYKNDEKVHEIARERIDAHHYHQFEDWFIRHVVLDGKDTLIIRCGYIVPFEAKLVRGITVPLYEISKVDHYSLILIPVILFSFIAGWFTSTGMDLFALLTVGILFVTGPLPLLLILVCNWKYMRKLK